MEPLSAAPASTFEDEISEPEYDTIAGTMAGVKDKREPKGEYDDSSDDDAPRGGGGGGGADDSEELEDSDGFVE